MSYFDDIVLVKAMVGSNGSAASKEYVDTALNDYIKKAGISSSRKIPYFSTTENGSYYTMTGGTGYTEPLAGGVVPVTTSGKISVGTPTGPYHAATKQYVDDAVNRRLPDAITIVTMYNNYSYGVIDVIDRNVPNGGTTPPFIMLIFGDGTESSEPPLEASSICLVVAEYIPNGDGEGHIINVRTPNGLYYATQPYGEFEFTV